jgi:ketosteroid isomerase-like protein
MSAQESGTPTVQQIADALREAHEKGGGPALVDVLARFVADNVTVRHHPPRRYVDGVFTGPEWIEFERTVIAKVQTKAAYTPSVDKKVWVEDDTVIVEETLVGQAPDGTEFRLPSKLVLPVRDGQILGYDAYYDASAAPAFMENAEFEVREGR